MQKLILLISLIALTSQYNYSNCSLNAPVCGSNNITYQNACLCQQASVQVAYATSCTTTQTTYLSNTLAAPLYNLNYGYGRNLYNNHNHYYGYGNGLLSNSLNGGDYYNGLYHGYAHGNNFYNYGYGCGNYCY